MSQKTITKLTAMRKIMRKKFKKAFTNRIENENNVNRAMNLTSSVDLKSENREFPLHNHSEKTNISPQSHLTPKSRSNPAIESKTNKNNKKVYHDPNSLCNSLRILLAASLNDTDVKHMQQIKSILSELRKLEIII